MVVFRFNPPAPHCLGRKVPCRLCPKCPKYWRLVIPGFSIFDFDTGEITQFDDSQCVLEWDPYEGTPDANFCRWDNRFDLVQDPNADFDDPLQPRPRGDGDFLNIITDWQLKTTGSYGWGTAIDPNTLFQEWHVSGNGEVVYTLGFSVFSPGGSRHFQCLKKNLFFYAGSVGDIGGEGDPTQQGYPPFVSVEPYWP